MPSTGDSCTRVLLWLLCVLHWTDSISIELLWSSTCWEALMMSGSSTKTPVVELWNQYLMVLYRLLVLS